jgi:hypothetical protein
MHAMICAKNSSKYGIANDDLQLVTHVHTSECSCIGAALTRVEN